MFARIVAAISLVFVAIDSFGRCSKLLIISFSAITITYHMMAGQCKFSTNTALLLPKQIAIIAIRSNCCVMIMTACETEQIAKYRLEAQIRPSIRNKNGMHCTCIITIDLPCNHSMYGSASFCLYHYVDYLYFIWHFRLAEDFRQPME